MPTSDGPSIDWDALLAWYLSADPVMADLDSCCAIVESLPTGSAEANRESVEALSAITHEAELWLLANPCPEEWSGRYLGNIIGMFVAIGELVLTGDGTVPDIATDVLKTEVDNARGMMDGVREVIHRLTVEHVRRSTQAPGPDGPPHS